jgi:hypothetical protein
MEALQSFEMPESKHTVAQWDIPEQLNLLKNVGMSTRVHSVISQKTWMWIIVTIRTSNLMYQSVWTEKFWIPVPMLLDSLLTDLSVAQTLHDHTVGWHTDNECAGICKEMVTVKFEVLYHHLYGGTEQDHKTLSQDRQSPGWDLNFTHP